MQFPGGKSNKIFKTPSATTAAQRKPTQRLPAAFGLTMHPRTQTAYGWRQVNRANQKTEHLLVLEVRFDPLWPTLPLAASS